MADAARARKIADRIKVVVAANLEHLVKDPDLGFVTVTDVRVTNDLQHATLFYTVLGEEDQRARTAALLERHKGKLRSFVGKQIGIRLTPTLEFIADAIPETAAHLDELLKEARQRDAATAARAASAKYAGEPDPYRKPEPGEVEAEPDGELRAEADGETDGEARGGVDGAVRAGTVSGGPTTPADVEERERAANRGR